MGGKEGQGSVEFMVAVSFVILLFIAVTFLVMEREGENWSLKVFLDAKRVAGSMADNINTIAQQGVGYNRSFWMPSTLYGNIDYNLTVIEGDVEIRWLESSWGKKLITDNVTLINMTKGGMNCVANTANGVFVDTRCPDV